MSLNQVRQVLLLRQTRTFALVFLVAFLAATLVTLTTERQYGATASLFVGENRPVSQGANAVQLDDVLARTYVEVLQTPAIRRKVTAALGDEAPISPANLKSRVSVDFLTGTHLIQITAFDPSPSVAQRLANTYASVFVVDRNASAVSSARSRLHALAASIQRLAATVMDLRSRSGRSTQDAARMELAQTQLEAARSSYNELQSNVTQQGANVNLASPAQRPTAPSKPKVALNLAVASFISLILAIGAAFLRNAFDQRIRSEAELGELLHVPVLSRVPVASRVSKGAFEEAFQFLRANLQYRNAEEVLIAVTSAQPAEGKSTVVEHLVRSFASAGDRVIALDGDLRRPALSKRLGVNRDRPGLVDILADRRTVQDALAPVPDSSALILGVDQPPDDPSVWFSGFAFSDLLHDVRGKADWIVADTAPVTAAAETSALVTHADEILLVVDLNLARRDQLVAARNQLEAVGVRITGVVLNRVGERDNTFYSGYYGRADGNAESGRKRRVRVRG